MQRLTKDKADKAAWSISQRLFDAVRHGITHLEKKSKHLSDARDTIKNVHLTTNPTTFGDACGDILVFWMTTLKTHQAIFQAIVDATESPAGIEQTPINEGFDMLVNAAKTVITVTDNMVNDLRKTMNYKRGIYTPVISEEESGSDYDTEALEKESDKLHEATAAAVDSQVSDDSEASETPEVQNSLTKKRKMEKDGEPVSLPLRSPDKPPENVKVKSHSTKSTPVPVESKIKTETDDSIAAPEVSSSRKKAKAKRNKKKQATVSEASAEPQATSTKDTTEDVDMMFGAPPSEHASANNDMPPPPLPSASEARRPSYDNIDDEVDARVLAKAAKNKEKKERKKRKRDSNASSIFDPAEGEVVFLRPGEIKEEVAETPSKKDMPPKKRTKLDIKLEVDGDGEDSKVTARVAKKESKKAKKDKASASNDFDSARYVSPFDNEEDANDQNEVMSTDNKGDEKGTDTKTKKDKKKSKRRHSSDGPGDQSETKPQLHSIGKKAKRVKTGYRPHR